MTSRAAVAVLVALLACAGCRANRPVVQRAPPTADRPLLPALEDPDPEVRRRAAECLGRLQRTSRTVIGALLAAQYDEDDTVAAAAVSALNRIQPAADVAVLVPDGTSFRSVVEVMVRPAYTTWEEIDRERASVAEGERPTACWRLVEVPPVYQTRIKQASPRRIVWRNASEARAEARDREIAAVRAAPPPAEVPPIERVVPPEGEPEGAQPGEVWCWYATPADGQWRRHPE